MQAMELGFTDSQPYYQNTTINFGTSNDSSYYSNNICSNSVNTDYHDTQNTQYNQNCNFYQNIVCNSDPSNGYNFHQGNIINPNGNLPMNYYYNGSSDYSFNPDSNYFLNQESSQDHIQSESIEQPLQKGKSRRGKRSIMQDIKDLFYSDDIKLKACDIFQNLKLGNVRRDSRKMAICYCLYQAHLYYGSRPDPMLIGQSLGLSKSLTHKAMSTYTSYSRTGYRGFDGYTDPIDLIPEYARDPSFRFTEVSIEDMKSEWIKITTKYPDIMEKPPRTVVAAFIWWYMSIYGMNMDCNEFASKFGLSFTTIKTLYSEIVKIDNEYNGPSTGE